MQTSSFKRPVSITILALLSLLCALSFVLPVAMVAAVTSLTDSAELLSQLAGNLKVTTDELKIAAYVLILQMLLFMLISAGLFWRWKLAWYLLAGFVLDGTVVPLIMLSLQAGSTGVPGIALTIINSLACLMVVRWLLRKEICGWFELTVSRDWRFNLLLFGSLIVNLPLFYLGRFVQLG